jgi:hypothetical protein
MKLISFGVLLAFVKLVLILYCGKFSPHKRVSISFKLLTRIRAGSRHVGATGGLIIWHTFKPIFFKYVLIIYLVGAGRNSFILAFTFRHLCKKSRVEAWVNWHYISDLFQWDFSAPCKLAHRADAQLARPLIQPQVVYLWSVTHPTLSAAVLTQHLHN